MKKIVKLTESDLNRIVKRVLSEQNGPVVFSQPPSNSVTSKNPVANKIAQPDATKKPVSKKLPTDYNKAITFLFPDNTIAVIKPQKQDVSKAIVQLLGLGEAPTNNVISLVKSGGAQKVCGTNAFTKKLYIFTRPNNDIDQWCSVSDPNPEYMKKSGIFEIPYKQEFVTLGTWKSTAPQTTTQG